MKKIAKERVIWICLLVICVVLGWSFTSFGDFYVIPVIKKMFAPVPKTGQTASYTTGDDGDLEIGMSWPTPRLTDNQNGSVTDNLTGLVWMKNANCFENQIWETAIIDCNTLAHGSCGLSDGSASGDWRLPNIKELLSLTSYEYNLVHVLPVGHPFLNVIAGKVEDKEQFYWSSTSFEAALRAREKIISHFRIPSPGHLRPRLNHKILNIAGLCLRSCSIVAAEPDPNLGAKTPPPQNETISPTHVKLFFREPLVKILSVLTSVMV